MLTSGQIAEILTSDKWDDSAKWIIKWQFGELGGFETALALAIMRADQDNLERLAKGFPIQVEGFRQWAYGDLARTFHQAGYFI
jgi:hypothetical protein